MYARDFETMSCRALVFARNTHFLLPYLLNNITGEREEHAVTGGGHGSLPAGTSRGGFSDLEAGEVALCGRGVA